MTEPRYIKQRDKYRCGPVAIMNILKWSGETDSHNYLRDWATYICGCEPPHGTAHKEFEKGLRQASKCYGRSFTVRKVMHPTLAEIEKHLRSGGAVVMNYYWERGKKNARHYSVLVDVSDSGRSFRVINGRRRGRAAKWISREDFKKWERRFQRTDKNHKAWFVTLKNKREVRRESSGG